MRKLVVLYKIHKELISERPLTPLDNVDLLELTIL